MLTYTISHHSSKLKKMLTGENMLCKDFGPSACITSAPPSLARDGGQLKLTFLSLPRRPGLWGDLGSVRCTCLRFGKQR